MTTLTYDQEQAYYQLVEFLKDPNQRIALLTGSGGTGKGFLIQHLIQLQKRYRFFCSSTTNKATAVQMEQASNAGSIPDGFGTIYSLLGLKLMPSGEIKTVHQTGQNKFSDYDVVITDEISMADERLVGYLQEALKGNKTKVILVGDRNQLPPVKASGKESPAFSIADIQVELREVVRHEGPILKLCNQIRDCIETEEDLPQFRTEVLKETGEGVFVLNRETWKQWMLKGFTSPEYQKDGRKFKSIAWRNKTVDRLNRFIRRGIYGEQAEDKFIVGEAVLTAAPIFEYEELLAPTDATGRVIGIEQDIHYDPVVIFYGEFRVWRLQIAFDNGVTAEANVLDDRDKDLFDSTLAQLRDEAVINHSMWGTYHNFRDAFADIRYSHAITSHRSQGSTFDNVFVDVEDIVANPNQKERLRSLYVACSRASKNLILYQG